MSRWTRAIEREVVEPDVSKKLESAPHLAEHAFRDLTPGTVELHGLEVFEPLGHGHLRDGGDSAIGQAYRQTLGSEAFAAARVTG